jgi:hypothetical protein
MKEFEECYAQNVWDFLDKKKLLFDKKLVF